MSSPSAHDAFRDEPGQSFIGVLRKIADAAGPDGLTVGEIVDRLDERAFGLLIFTFTLPCLVPGLPGAQVIAIAIFLLAVQLAFGRREPWLPGWMLRANVKQSWLEGIAGFAEKRLRWTERLARPRMQFLTAGAGERLLALVAALAAVTIMLPITNTIPSLALTVLCVGLMQRDGLFAGAGALLALAWVGALVALVVGLLTGAGFAMELVQERAPWLGEALGGPGQK